MGTDGVHVHRDDVLVMLDWSNTAVTLRCAGNWTSDEDHNPRMIETPDTASGSARAAVLAVAPPFRTNGVIDGLAVGFVGTGATQRGQVYVQVVLVRGATVTGTTIVGGITVQTLTAGYVYAGHALALGEYEEPGPAGGHGQITAAVGANPAAGVLATDVLAVTGVYRRLISYEIVLVTDANAGNRQFALVIDNGTASQRLFVAQNSNTQAATLTRTWAWYIGTDLSTSVGATFTDTAVMLPAYNLKRDVPGGGYGSGSVRLVSTGTLAFTATDDFAAPTIQFEEWVMPN